MSKKKIAGLVLTLFSLLMIIGSSITHYPIIAQITWSLVTIVGLMLFFWGGFPKAKVNFSIKEQKIPLQESKSIRKLRLSFSPRKLMVLLALIAFVGVLFYFLGFRKSAFNIIPASLQTTISEKACGAAETSPVQITPSPDWTNNDVAKGTGFEIEYDAKPHEYIYPLDNEIDRSLKVKNTGAAAAEFQFDASVYSRDGTANLGIPPFPQTGNHFHLEPGETQTIYTVVSWNELLPSSLFKDGASYDYKTVIKVFPAENSMTAQTVTLINRAKILTTGFRGSPALPSNANICGYVKTDGKPVANAKVQVSVQNGQKPYNTQTDANGLYKVGVFAHKMVELGNYLTYNISVDASGYNDFNQAVTLKEGQNVRLDVTLGKKKEKATYEVLAKYDIKLNAHRGAASKDGKYFAIAPFHTIGLPAEFNKADNAYLYFFDTDGHLLWKYKLNGQVPTVDVSDDGKYVATIVQSPLDEEPSWGKMYIFDNKGNILWNFADGVLGPGPANPKGDRGVLGAVKFSHNGRYLAVGDGAGSFNLLDTNTHQSVWKANIGEGMIRNVEFEADDSVIYISGANGYLYAYKSSGAFVWRTYVGAWVYAMAVSKNYIMTTAKNGYYTYLLDKNGKVVWKTFVPHTGFQVAISPDESYMAYFSEAGGANVDAFDKNGAVNFFIPPGANSGTISDDGKYVVLTGVEHNSSNSAYVKLITKDGNTVWTKDFDSTINHPVGGYAWISPDKTRIIATAGEHIYFLKGTITQY